MGKKFDHDIWTLKKIAESPDYSLHIAFWPQEDEKVLVKIVNPSLPQDRKAKVEERLLKEASTLEEFWSPYFPKIYDIRKKEGDVLYIISEYFPGSTLKDFLKSEGLEIDAKFYFYLKDEISFALSYLHQRKKVVHLDISPDNVIIDLDKNIHIIDFENSKLQGELWDSKDFRGKANYIAPELKKESQLEITEALDYFAFGTLLLEIFTKLSPFQQLLLWREKKEIRSLRSDDPQKRILKSKPQEKGFVTSIKKPLIPLLLVCFSLAVFLMKKPHQKKTIITKKTTTKVIAGPGRAPAIPKNDRITLKQSALKKRVKSKISKPSFRSLFNKVVNSKDRELLQCLKLFPSQGAKSLRLRYHLTKAPVHLDHLEFMPSDNLSNDAKICIRSVYSDPKLKYPSHPSGKSYRLIQSINF